MAFLRPIDIAAWQNTEQGRAYAAGEVPWHDTEPAKQCLLGSQDRATLSPEKQYIHDQALSRRDRYSTERRIPYNALGKGICPVIHTLFHDRATETVRGVSNYDETGGRQYTIHDLSAAFHADPEVIRYEEILHRVFRGDFRLEDAEWMKHLRSTAEVAKLKRILMEEQWQEDRDYRRFKRKADHTKSTTPDAVLSPRPPAPALV